MNLLTQERAGILQETLIALQSVKASQALQGFGRIHLCAWPHVGVKIWCRYRQLSDSPTVEQPHYKSLVRLFIVVAS